MESKLDDIDTVDGYKYFTLNWKSIARYRSGGIALLVNNDISDNIEVLEFQTKLMLLFTEHKMNKKFFVG
jgi:hypothetical protein